MFDGHRELTLGTKRHIARIALASVLAYGPMVAIHAFCISGGGGWVIAGVEWFVFVPFLALLVGLITLPFALRSRTRQAAIAVLVVVGGLILCFIPARLAAYRLRMLGFSLAASRAQPLVQAIKRHVADHGRPPDGLLALIPRYIDRIPSGLPELEFVTGERARKGYGGNEWALYAVVPTGVLNWDQFLYLPDQRYPEVGYGGWLERVGDWAYVHE